LITGTPLLYQKRHDLEKLYRVVALLSGSAIRA